MRQIFLSSSLGKYYKSLPIEELSKLLPKRPSTQRGPKGWLSNKGKIGLQFLKPYLKLSDEKLLERLNSDWMLQYFCDLRLKLGSRIKDDGLIWRTRKEVALHLQEVGLTKYQEACIQVWKPDLEDTQIGLCDATCYESYIKYPTDVELLWDCVEWLKSTIALLCQELTERQPRNKYHDQKRRFQTYMRRRKTKKQEKRRRKQLLYLCNKMIGQLEDLLQIYTQYLIIKQQELELISPHPDQEKNTLPHLNELLSKMKIIQKVQEQQTFHFENPSESVPNRIVSLFKTYIRPIVRGKSKKRVEFGAKVNTWQVGGLNFIEHLSFNAFHEGIRLKQSIAFHTKNFGKLIQLGADKIYATNENRKHCTALGIQTNFVPKGRRTQDPVKRKQEDKARQVLGKARSTILEGTYGNDKNHYGLQKINARSQITEVLFIFFGMMAANAMKITKNKKKRKPPK
jgi:hypothetical protein